MAFSFARQALLGIGTVLLVLPAWAADGKAVYDKTCVACHAAGVANAPKLGDKAAWAPRVATGKDALIASVMKGKGAMPPKAGAASLQDDEIAAAVDFMLSSVK
jgi:cytochrome c5